MTIKQIAQKAGVSTATISYVLNNRGNISDETREKVKKVIDEYNYKPNSIAKSLRVKCTKTIGVLVEDITVFQTPKIINGINAFAEESGYHIVLSDLRLLEKIENRFDEIENYIDKIKDSIDVLLSSKVDGIIYVAMHDRKIEGIFENVKIPVVYTYCYTDNPKDFSVTYENQDISYDATKYLISRGHKRIAMISGAVNSTPAHKRMLGYQTALMNSGLEFHPEYIKIGDWKYDFGYSMGDVLLNLPERPTAIFAMNDVMALGALEAARKNNLRVPEDISIIGFDNIESSSYSYPKLTTVSLPLKDMGYTAAELIEEKIMGKPIEKKSSIVLPCKLIIRESVSDLL